jgi:hypothetical protein
MKKDGKEWTKVDIGEEGMQRLIKIARESNDFSSKFCEDPIDFCETQKFKVYNGYSTNRDQGRTYVIVHKIENNKFAIFWLFLDGKMPSVVIEEDILNKIQKDCDFLGVDNEVFMIWLKDNVELVKSSWKKGFEDFEKYKSKQKNGI